MKGISTSYHLPLFTLILFSFFCETESSFAQEKVKLEGVITVDSLQDFTINILNLTAHSGTITKPDGSFIITVKKEDELLFTAMGYKPYELVVNDSVIESQPIRVQLEQAINRLGEVHLSNVNLTGDLTKDVEDVPYFDQTKFGIPHASGPNRTKAERRLYAASTGGGLLPLDPIVNAITGRLAMLNRQVKYEGVEAKKEGILGLLDDSFFTDQLNIPKDQIEDFLYYCILNTTDSHVYDQRKPFELIEYIELKAKEYLESVETREEEEHFLLKDN